MPVVKLKEVEVERHFKCEVSSCHDAREFFDYLWEKDEQEEIFDCNYNYYNGYAGGYEYKKELVNMEMYNKLHEKYDLASDCHYHKHEWNVFFEKYKEHNVTKELLENFIDILYHNTNVCEVDSWNSYFHKIEIHSNFNEFREQYIKLVEEYSGLKF